MTEPTPAPSPALPNYWDYLHIEELLGLQDGLEGDEAQLSNHEVLFIVVHQVFELWFKLVLRELTTARDLLDQNPVPDQDMSLLVAGLSRTRVIFDQAVAHFSVMETLTTRDFLDFRDKLLPASGFQSAQMRELEVLLGLKDEDRISLGAHGGYLKALRDSDGSHSSALDRVERRKASGRSLADVLDDWLARTPIRGSSPGDAGDDAVVASFIADFIASLRAEHGDLHVLAARQSPTVEGRAKLVARYEESIESARAYLEADDAPEEERMRRRRIRAALVFIESYRELPLLAWPRAVLSGFVALEQSVVMFRQRHARMVEREIGRRVGTGGSAGVDYLDQTALRYRVFRDLWAARTILIRKDAVPPLADGSYYGFRSHD